MTNSDLSTEALVAVTGIFPDEPVKPSDAYQATLLPGEWRSSIKEFFDRTKPLKFKKTRLPMSYQKTGELLVNPDDDPRWLQSNFQDQDVGNAYVLTISNAREYLRERWPRLSIEAFPLPIMVDPGKTFIAEMGTLYTTINNPSTVVKEMLSHSLQPDQVSAFVAVYPALYDLLLSLIEERKKLELSKVKSWRASWGQERILRHLYQLPIGKSISEAPRANAQTASVSQAKINLTSDSTKSEHIESKENQ